MKEYPYSDLLIDIIILEGDDYLDWGFTCKNNKNMLKDYIFASYILSSPRCNLKSKEVIEPTVLPNKKVNNINDLL
jgi:hypothetical protein